MPDAIARGPPLDLPLEHRPGDLPLSFTIVARKESRVVTWAGKRLGEAT